MWAEGPAKIDLFSDRFGLPIVLGTRSRKFPSAKTWGRLRRTSIRGHTRLDSTIAVLLWERDLQHLAVLELLHLTDRCTRPREQVALVAGVLFQQDLASAHLAGDPGWIDPDQPGHLADGVPRRTLASPYPL